MTATRRAEYRIDCDDAAQAARLARSLSIEAEDGPPRTRTVITAEASQLLIVIESDDTRGLRAATNSFLRWAQTALDVDRLAARGAT